MKIDSFLICSNQFHFTIRCNSIKVLPYNFISFCLDGREIFQCSSDEYYLDFYKLSDFGIAAYILVRRTNEEICKIIDSKSEDFQEAPEESPEESPKESPKEINDSSAIEQELVYSKKEFITEDFVKFEEFLKNKIDRVSLLEIIRDYFPCCEIHLKRHGRIEVTTRAGTFFTLIPDYYGINDFSIREHKYNISLCIF